MASIPGARFLWLSACLASAFTVVGLAQRPGGLQEYDREGPNHHNDAVGGPLTGPRVVGAPFTADATTVLRKTTLVGRKTVNLTGKARYYRNGAGRVRVEQPLPPDDSKPGEGPLVWVTIDNPDVASQPVAIDARTGTPGVLPRFILANCIGGGHTFAVPLGYGREPASTNGYPHFLVLDRPLDYYDVRTLRGLDTTEESLGTRTIEGVGTVGHRTTIVIPGGFGSDTPVELIDERWESPELQLLIYSRVSDSQTGTIEYRLTDVKRGEPPAGVFVIDKNMISSTGVGIGEEPWGNNPWR